MKNKNIDLLIFILFIIMVFLKLTLIEYLFYTISTGNENLTYFKYVLISTILVPFNLYKLAQILLLTSLFWLGTKKNKILIAFVIDLFLSIFSLAFIWYARAFEIAPSLYLFQQFSNLDGLGGSILEVIRLQDIWFIIDLFVLGILFFLSKDSLKERSIKGFLSTSIIGLSLIIIIPILHIQFLSENKSSSEFYQFQPMETVMHISPLGYIVKDALSTIQDNVNEELTEEENKEVDIWFEEHSKLNRKEDNIYKGISEDKNIILIQFESLETVAIHKEIEGEEVTPFLNDLITKSVYFPHIKEQVLEGNSSDAEFMINTGLYPITKGSSFYRYSSKDFQALPVLYQEEGYTTITAHGDKKTFWNRHKMYPQLGYQKYWDIDYYKSEDNILMGLSDEAFYKETIEMLSNEEEPYFVQLITLTSHLPFTMPEDRKVKSFDSLENKNVKDYMESISYADYALELFFKELEGKGMLENSTIIIYGDHQGLNKYYDIQDEEWNNNDNLPLIIYSKDIKPKQFDIVGGQVDIMPTILHLSGIENTPKLIGKNLFEVEKGFAVYYKKENSIDIPQSELEGYKISELYIRSLENK